MHTFYTLSPSPSLKLMTQQPPKHLPSTLLHLPGRVLPKYNALKGKSSTCQAPKTQSFSAGDDKTSRVIVLLLLLRSHSLVLALQRNLFPFFFRVAKVYSVLLCEFDKPWISYKIVFVSILFLLFVSIPSKSSTRPELQIHVFLSYLHRFPCLNRLTRGGNLVEI